MLDMSSLVIGSEYTSPELAMLWGYKSHHALVKGIVTPKDSNQLILFVTKEKQSGATQYEDNIEGNLLYMMGQEAHGTDERICKNLGTNIDDIFLFFREKHHTPFVYYGECTLLDFNINLNKPSEFKFLINEGVGDITSRKNAMMYLEELSNEEPDDVTLSFEGVKKLVTHIRYERNSKNRRAAIEAHGSTCMICGFNFNDVYGPELADSYIEIHHVKPLSEGAYEVDPEKDLIPVCANCHRMLHRKRNGNVSIEELREIIK